MDDESSPDPHTACCERGNEPSISVKGMEFLDQPSY